MTGFTFRLPVIQSGPQAVRMVTGTNIAACLGISGDYPLSVEHFRFLAPVVGDGMTERSLKAWLRDEVLPAIFTEGGYILPADYREDPEALLQKGLDIGRATGLKLLAAHPELAGEYAGEHGKNTNSPLAYRRALELPYRLAQRTVAGAGEQSSRTRKRHAERQAREEAAEQRRLRNETRMLQVLEAVYSGKYHSQLEVLAALPFFCTPGTLSKLKRKAIRMGLTTAEKWREALNPTAAAAAIEVKDIDTIDTPESV